MFQRGEICQPQAGARLAHPIPGRGEGREVAVAEGQQHDLGGRLPEIDRFGRLVEGACFDPRDMHGRFQAPSMAAIAPRSRPFSPITTSRLAARLAGAHGTIEIAAKPLTDALDQQAHRLARDFDIAFYAQNVVRARRLAEPSEQRVGLGDGGQIEHERIEIVVVVLARSVVMRGPSVEIVLGRGLQPEQHVGLDAPLARRDDLHRARDRRRNRRARALRARSVETRSLLLSTTMSAQSNWSS